MCIMVKQMNLDNRKKFNVEIRSFLGLTIINLVFGALAIAIGVSTVVNNIQYLMELSEISIIPSILVCIGGFVFLLGLYWIISSVEILDGITDITEEYKNFKGRITDDYFTSLIIRMMAQYRSNKTIIHRMVFIGRIGGHICIIAGIIEILFTLYNLNLSYITLDNLISIVGSVITLLLGFAIIIIVRYFNRYTKIWEKRLSDSNKTEKALQNAMGGT